MCEYNNLEDYRNSFEKFRETFFEDEAKYKKEEMHKRFSEILITKEQDRMNTLEFKLNLVPSPALVRLMGKFTVKTLQDTPHIVK